MADYFWGQAYNASFHVVLDVMAKWWLVIFLGYKLTYFLNIKVACLLAIMMPANELYPDDFQDLGEALVV